MRRILAEVMAMLNIRNGTTVCVPWRIQGIVRNEDRLRVYTLRQLEKQNKYLLNSLAREQMLATNRLGRFMEKLNNASRTSDIMARANKNHIIQGKNPSPRETWQQQLPSSFGQTTPLTKQQESSTPFLPDISIPRHAVPPRKTQSKKFGN